MCVENVKSLEFRGHAYTKILKGLISAEEWSKSLADLHINKLEMRAVMLILLAFQYQIINNILLSRVDDLTIRQ